ncbi:MAG: hypothetical protein HY912_00625 [Desulfomonile tiedjei]|uniref:Uncharacterized protein n=1 Tax=Desulfomonile tiedjei TaxID=2358 RepID=A0A9D6V292_9BACT|nr:hypothetical protein [Desulfomonile tiedjei]
MAVKYCGGCDPIYDRVELVQRIKSEAGESIEWLTLDEQGYEAILVVCGCLKACPEDELRHLSPLSLKYDGLSPERVVAQLLEKGRTDANQD